MPSINMIAVRREEKRRQEQNIRKLLYAILGEVGLVVLAVFVLTARILVTQNQVARLSERVTALQPSVTKIQQLQGETAAMMPKVQTLDGAKADTLFWYKNFYAVTTSLPPKTWLTSLGTGTAPVAGTGAVTPGTAGGDDPTLNLMGVAMSQAVVGETMLRMDQSPALDHVDLAFVQQQKLGATQAVAFQMTVHLKPEAGPAPAKDALKPAAPGGTKTADTKTADAKGAINGTKS